MNKNDALKILNLENITENELTGSHVMEVNI